jgi:ATP-binding cassette, subfamily B, bacterial
MFKLIRNLHTGEFIRLISLMRERAWVYWISLILGCVTFACNQIIIAFVNKEMLDGVIDGQTWRIMKAVYLALVVLILACIVSPICSYFFERNVKQTMVDIARRLFMHIEKLPMSYYEKNHSGEVISRLTNDFSVFEAAYSSQMNMLVTAVFYGVGSIISMFSLDWRLSLLMVILGIGTTIVSILFTGTMRKIGDRIQSSMGTATQYFGDVLAGFRVMKMFNISDIILKKYIRENNKTCDLRQDIVRKYSEMYSLNYILYVFTRIGIFIVGSFMVAAGQMSFGTVMAIVTLHGGVAFMFFIFGNFFPRLQASLAGAARVFELLDTAEEPEHYEVGSAPDNEEMITFKNVDFDYETRERVLDRLNISISKGQITALVGTSGGGKSTIVKLLLGFYEPTSGDIIVNGKPLREYTLQELRRLMAYVPQDAYLFEGSVEENIRFGRPNASSEEIIEAAKAANAQEFIEKMPEGYNTMVGERGMKLSGGQRQRIAIARAVLKNAPILLLDEATSSLDSENEQMVQQALGNLMKRRTSIVIAHRLSTIEHADIIYVIDDGKVVEKGNHNDLLDQEGFYKRLCELQFKNENLAEAL